MKVNAASGQSVTSDLARINSTRLDRWVLERIQQTVASAPIRFALWDGFEIPVPGGAPVGTILFKTRGALLSWLWDPHLNLGETYTAGSVEIHGDLFGVLDAGYRALTTKVRPWWLWQPSNSLTSSRHNVHHHYDLGNDFYRLWLDRDMVYTCAYFPTPEATLEEAQIAKMDRVCRKLRLQAGERVVETGCGWGSLALFMAKHYGVTVTALNISTEQIAYARQRAREQGLSDRVEFVEDDYRNITGHYDKFVSVGMLEHVGAENYPELGRVIKGCLKDSGLGLIHTIGRNRAKLMHRWIDRRIFPGAHPPSLKEMMDIFENCNFSVLDVENLRLHYAKTLEWWHALYERSTDKVAKMFDDRFVRMWRLYLLGSQAAFSVGELQLFQVVFAPGRNNQIPWTRADIYQR